MKTELSYLRTDAGLKAVQPHREIYFLQEAFISELLKMLLTGARSEEERDLNWTFKMFVSLLPS